MATRTIGRRRAFLVLVAVAVVAVAGNADSRAAAGHVDASVPGGAVTTEAVATEAAMTTRSCRARDDCGSSLKAGLRITFTGWACTIGIIARGVEDDTTYAVAAGHCISGSGVYAQWSHHGAVIGRAALNAFEGDSAVDAGAIEIPAASVSDELFATDRGDIRTVTAVVPNHAQALGTEVCRSGGTSGWSCGHVVSRDVPTRIEGKPVEHTWWTDFPSAKGDSGSPIVDRQGRLLGIAVATTGTQTVYVPIDEVLKALHVRPCLDAACR